MNPEVEKLLEHSIEYASDLLVETGESYPFGAFIDTIGNVHPLEMEVTDTKNMPKIGQVIEALTIYCEGELAEGKLKGYALAYEVRLQLEEGAAPQDAIAFEMKHIEQESIDLFYLPYSTLQDKKVELGNIFAVKR